MLINSSLKDVLLDCSIDKFIKNGIPEEDAKVLLKHLHYCIGDLNFKLLLKTDNVFGNNTTQGFEEGKILCDINQSVFEHARRVEDGGICLAFLFFANALSTKSWMAVPRGKGYDYSTVGKQNNIIVVEAGARTTKYGARNDLSVKIARFKRLGSGKEPTYISSVGFMEGEHIVHRFK